MRVGLVTPYSWTVPGGVNNHVEHLADELERRGHTAWIMAPMGVMFGRRRVDGRRLHATGRLVPMGSSIPVSSNGSVAYISLNPRVFARMDRAIGQLRLDVVHVHEPCLPPVSLAAVLLARSPVVGTFHAALKDPNVYDRYEWSHRMIMDRLDVRTAVSGEAARAPATRYPGDYWMIPNGVAVGRFAPARRVPKVPGRVLFIGRADPRKGLRILLEAFAGLRRRRPDTSLVVAGVTQRELGSLAAHGTSGRPIELDGVTALGWVGDDEKVRHLGAAEVVCVPSLSGESFGVVLIEALASGVPVVASDLPGYREVLRQGEIGSLAPPGDPLTLAKTLGSVLADEALRRRLSEAGIAAADTYAWEHVADRVELAYAEAASLDAAAGGRHPSDRPWVGRTLLKSWLWKSRLAGVGSDGGSSNDRVQ
jgi:phosphatidylinositol alpha-mannosyltransferase